MKHANPKPSSKDQVKFFSGTAFVAIIITISYLVEEPQDVVAGAAGNGHHGIRHLQSGLLYPAREVIAAADLLALPGPQGLQRVNGNDQRDAVKQFGQDAAEVGVPGVAVNDVGRDAVGIEGKAGGERLQG